MNRRHTWLIATHSARHSVRGGIGLVFLLASLTFGLLVAHYVLLGVEQVGKQTPTADAAEVLAQIGRRAKPMVAWVLVDKDSAQVPEARRAADAWATYLIEERPAILSAIFLILLFGWPLVVSFGAFDLYSSDIGSRQLRYQLLRTDRSSIFFGRLLGMLGTFALVLVLLGLGVTSYIALKLPVYGAGPLFVWAAYGTIAMFCVSVPYVALCAWISAACRSAFLSMTITSAVIGGVPLFATIAATWTPFASWLHYALPWPFQTRLFHPEPGRVALAVLGCGLQTVVFLWLGHRRFTRRDL